MRKLLILVLVLGMASMASATISFVTNSATINVSESYTVQVQSDIDSAGWTGYLGYAPGTVAALTSVWALPGAGDDATAPATSYAGYWQLNALDLTPPADSIVAGAQFEGTMQAYAVGTYDIYLYDSFWTGHPVVDTFTLTVVPEPITLALLGLGGLFLRRRK